MKRWRRTLSLCIRRYDELEFGAAQVSWRLFGFFTCLNISCYWLGILVAYPDKLFGPDRLHYFLLQFPVGILGAVFDTASFFITIRLIRRALVQKSAAEYCLHLSIDVLIAVVATFWVLFVFAASGWIMSYLESQPELLSVRSEMYGERLQSAVRHPGRNWRNLYFGLVMGISAALPTLFHLGLFVRSWRKELQFAERQLVTERGR